MTLFSNFKTIGVVGTGVIGSSWTALFLAKGYKVVVSDPAPGAEASLASYIKKEWPALERLGLEPEASPENYEFVSDVADHLSRIDFIQENAPEYPELKSKIFAALDEKAGPETIIASSSSGLPSSKFIGLCKNHPDRILIGHPFNPPHLIPLVEVVPHPGTGEKVVMTTVEFYQSLGKNPIVLKKEVPGFVANRMQAVVCAEAFSLVQNGVVSPREVDAALTDALGLRWAVGGPFMTMIAGGGGGNDGFKNMSSRLGPAFSSWIRDIEVHKVEFTPELLDTLDNEVQEWLKNKNLAEVHKQREEIVLKIIQLKQKASALE